MAENNRPKVLRDFKFQTVVQLLTIVVDDKEQKSLVYHNAAVIDMVIPVVSKI